MANEIINAHAYLFSRLPAEYQEVAWIGNRGRSYIDTLYKPNIDTEIEIIFSMADSSATTGNNIFGSANKANGTPGFLFGMEISDSAWTPWLRFHESGTNNWDFATIDAMTKYKLYFDKQKILFNDNTIAWQNPPNIASRLTCSLYLFCRHQNNSVFPTSGDFPHCNIYELQISEAGSMQRDFIPCYRISDSTIGMYDIIGNTFYSNLGSGTFAKGPNIN